MIRRAKDAVFLVTNRLALGILLTLLILAPIFLAGFFAHSWRDIVWKDKSDIFVITWSSGIASLFISLVCIEIFRQTLRKIHLYLCLLFLSLGISDLAYSLLISSNANVLWFKATGSLVAGIIIFASIFEFRKHSYEISAPLLRNLPPVFGLLILFNLMPLISINFLAKAYSGGGGISFACMFLFYVSGALFLLGSVPWMKSYMAHGGRENLNVGIVLICLAELFLMSRFLVSWTFFWWFWHLLFLILLLAFAIYLLTACVRKSFIWKIVLSLTMLFAVTMLISFWIVRKYYEKIDRETAIKIVSDRLSLLRNKSFWELSNSASALSAVAKTLESEKGLFSRADLVKTITLTGNNICHTKYENVGWLDHSGNDSESFSGRYLAPEAKSRILESYSKKRGDGVTVSIISAHELGVKGKEDKHLLLMTQNIMSGPFRGMIYHISEGAFLLKRSFGEELSKVGLEWGKLALDIKNKKIIYTNNPSRDKRLERDSDKIFYNAMISLAYDVRRSRSPCMIEERTNFGKLLIFADIEPTSGWLVADYCIGDFEEDNTAARVHIIAAMSAMLIGIVVMLIMMNILINRPLKKLMKAAISLQSGNFDFRTGVGREDEIGIVENVFDQTAERLKILYGNLHSSIREKDDALSRARKIEKEKRDFFNALSHELKNPIHCIINFSRFGKDSSSGDVHELFDKSYQNAIKLLEMIEELLQIARIEAMPKSENVHFSLRELIGETAWNFLPQAKPKDVKLSTSFSPERADFDYLGDRRQIQIALSNLIGNAVKYTNANTTVSISCEKETDAYLIKVSDEGPGIPKHQMDKLFMEFQRPSENKQPGSGLGLYISKKIISMHGGTIYAANNKDGGVAFFVKLPVQNEKR